MSDDTGERLTRLEVRLDQINKNVERIEKSNKDEIKDIKGKIGWGVMLVVAFVIQRLLGLFEIGAGQ